MTEDLEAQVWEINQSYVPQVWDGITVPKGWYRLVVDTHDKLTEIHPTYEIHQVKEKFGSMRYYTSFQGGDLDDEKLEAARKIIRDAEFKSSETCSFCGSEDAGLMCGSMWDVTACGNCAVENELEACEPEEEE